jgi:hypothetical protein
MKSRLLLVILLIVGFSAPTFSHLGPHADSDNVFTLYRDSVLDSTMRIHIATFDAKHGEDYNKENCAVAKDLFRGHPGVTVTYWCEPGYVKDAD